MRYVLILALTASIVVPAQSRPVSAAITIDEFQKVKTNRRPRLLYRYEIVVQHLGGVFEGFEWSNAFLRRRGELPLYCRPRNRRVGMSQVMAFIEAEIKKPSIPRLKKYRPDTPIEAIMLTALRVRWPCRR